MLESILYRGAKLVLPEGCRVGDLLIKDGKIAAIAPALSDIAELEIPSEGLTIMPGMIDSHLHFREPGATHKETIESGSKAAVSGGVTSFFEMPNTKPATVTAEAMAEKKDIASKTSLANYAFYIGATPDNLDVLNTVENVPGIKIYVGSSTGSLLVAEPEELRPIFENGDRIISVHSEDEYMVRANMETYADSTTPSDHYRIRSAEAAIKCTQMLHGLATSTKRRLHVLHITSAEEVQFLRENPSPYVTAEVCPHHLMLHGPDVYDRLGNLAKVNPPIREQHHTKALWEGLLDGTLHLIGSDHAPHTLEEKDQPFMKAPSGMPIVELTIPLLLQKCYEGRITINQIVDWTASRPAAFFGIPKKGLLKEGYDADLCIVDEQQAWTVTRNGVQSKAGWSAFEDEALHGKVLMTTVNGQIVFREGDFFEDYKGLEIQFNR